MKNQEFSKQEILSENLPSGEKQKLKEELIKEAEGHIQEGHHMWALSVYKKLEQGEETERLYDELLKKAKEKEQNGYPSVAAAYYEGIGDIKKAQELWQQTARMCEEYAKDEEKRLEALKIKKPEHKIFFSNSIFENIIRYYKDAYKFYQKSGNNDKSKEVLDKITNIETNIKEMKENDKKLNDEFIEMLRELAE